MELIDQTTPKKIKHKRKKVKMAILKYYKVGSDGKIQRLRRECTFIPVKIRNPADRQAPPPPVVLVCSWLGTRTGSRAASAGEHLLMINTLQILTRSLTYTFEPGTKPTAA